MRSDMMTVMYLRQKALSFWLFAAALAAPDLLAAPDALALGDGHDGARFLLGVNFHLDPFYGNVDTDVSVGGTTVNFSGTIVNTGDIVLIIKMTGASAVSADSSAVGQYEFRKVETASATSFTFADALKYAYTATDSQLFVVPQYSSLTLSNAAILMKPWDGSTGGVGVIFVQGELSIQDVSSLHGQGTGYRGGQANSNDSNSDCILDLKISENGGGAPKGEGITGVYGMGDLESAYGNYASGGGGGNCYGAGGGGGSNRGTGGAGGNQFDVSTQNYGGNGGSQMIISNYGSHTLMGGGGGAGHRNHNGDSAGASGGGVWLIRAGSFSNGSGSFGVLAAGTNALYAATDGAGGGGAGGTVIAHIHGPMVCSDSTGFVASGGDGGDVAGSYGPGGGGGGGSIQVRYVTGICPININGGTRGLDSDTASPRYATDGSAGFADVCTDSDFDGSCDYADLCTGLDYTGDTDSDGICDNLEMPELIFSNGFE